jgi:hypothetical protein
VKSMAAQLRFLCKTFVALSIWGAIAGLPARAMDLATAVICEEAAAEAARVHDIPPDILLGLTLTETGRNLGGRLRPWPWAINHAGQGHWFETRTAMLAHAEGLIAAGATNFDLGCFQLNYRWHAQNFGSLEAMIAPQGNAEYAARYLVSKYAVSRAWGAAVAAYHSSNPTHAATYLDRFRTIFAGLSAQSDLPETATTAPGSEAPASVAARANTFPFLVAGASGQGGSLVPVAAGHGVRLIGADN